MDLVWLAAPTLLFVILALLLSATFARDWGSPLRRLLLPAMMLVAAAATAVFALLPLRSPGIWQSNVQLAWTGLEQTERGGAASDRGLTIGGELSPDAALANPNTVAGTIGWPLGYGFPVVKLTEVADNKKIHLQATRQLGFLRRDDFPDQPILNATDERPINDAFTQRGLEGDSGYRFSLAARPCQYTGVLARLRHRDRTFCLAVAEATPGSAWQTVTDSDEVPLAFHTSGDDRAVALSGLLEPVLRRMRLDAADMESHPDAGSIKMSDNLVDRAGRLERWASTVLLLGRESGKTEVLYILASGPALDRPSLLDARLDLTEGEKLTLLWPRSHLTFAVNYTEAEGYTGTRGRRIAVDFQPPYRHSIPEPPDKTKAVVVERSAAPGDQAFLLPLALPMGDTEPGKALDLKSKGSAKEELAKMLKEHAAPLPAVEYPDFKLKFARVLAVPQVFGTVNCLTWLFLPAFVCLAVATFLLYLAMAPGYEHTLLQQSLYYGLILAVWGVLCLRFVLAFRFAFEPNHLDLHAITQLHYTVDTLALLPAVLAVVCAYAARPRRRIGWPILFLTLCSLILWWNAHLVGNLWSNYGSNGTLALPASLFHLSFSYYLPLLGLIAILLFAGPAIYGNWAANTRGRLMDHCYGLVDWFRERPSWPKAIVAFLLAAIGGYILAVFLHAVVIPAVLFAIFLIIYYVLLSVFPRMTSPLLKCLLALSCVALLHVLPIPRGFTKEVVLVAVQCIVILYGLRALEEGSAASESMGWGVGFFGWCLLVFVLAPASLDDVGGILAGIGFLGPLVLIAVGVSVYRWVTRREWSRESLRVAVMPLLLAALVGGLALTAVKTSYLDWAKRELNTPATERLSHWMEDRTVIQADVLAGRATANGAKRSQSQELSETDDQTWQNKAMIVLGGWKDNGVGFGNAPSRHSGIGQQTLQADSTFSFFVASEHGRRGSLALVLLFAMPLLLVFATHNRGSVWTTNERFALVLCAAFLIECLIHILMNMEWVPMTGRSMPLLTTKSSANTTRWLLLLALAVRNLAVERRDELDPADAAADSLPVRVGWWLRQPVLFAPASVILFGVGFFWMMGHFTRQTEESAFLQSTIWSKHHSTPQGGVNTKDDSSSADDSYDPCARPVMTADLQSEFDGMTEEKRKELALVSTRGVYMVSAHCYLRRQPQGHPGIVPVVDDPANVHDVRLRPDGVGPNYPFSKLAEEVARFNGLPVTMRAPDIVADGCEEKFPYDKTRYMRCLYDQEASTHQQTAKLRPALFRLRERPFVDSEYLEFATSPPEAEVNPSFQNAVDFSPARESTDMPIVAYAGHTAVSGWQIKIGQQTLLLKKGPPHQQSVTSLKLENGNIAAGATRSYTTPLTVKISACDSMKSSHGTEKTGTGTIFTLDLDDKEGLMVPPGEYMNMIRFLPNGNTVPFGHGSLKDGYHLESLEEGCHLKNHLEIYVHNNGLDAADELIGPAWVDGEETLVTRKGEPLPWLPSLATALRNDAVLGALPPPGPNRTYQITLDQGLQQAAAKFVDTTAVKTYKAQASVIPIRTGMVVMDLANGEVLASAGWPHPSSDGVSRIDPDQIAQLREDWLESAAPADVRNRFAGDRNFDTLPVGSASKPIWAAAALHSHPELRSFRIRYTQDEKIGGFKDFQVFGYPLVKMAGGWETDGHQASTDSEQCCNLEQYLAISDNRFQTRLNFAALNGSVAETPDGVGTVCSAQSGVDNMSLLTIAPPSGHDPYGAHELLAGNWGDPPKIPNLNNISQDQAPQSDQWLANLNHLDKTILACNLHAMFPMEADSTVNHSASFWTGDEHSDTGDVLTLLSGISPRRTSLQLDAAPAGKSHWSGRDFVSVLVGGSTNRWSNFNLASAFSTALTGFPIVPHILQRQSPVSVRDAALQQTTEELRAALQPGLRGVIFRAKGARDANGKPIVWGGTANPRMDAGNGKACPGVIEGGAVECAANVYSNYDLYAKTGTLPESKDPRRKNWSRVIVVITPKEPHHGYHSWHGLLIAVYVEGVAQGTASSWANAFLVGDAKDDLLKHLSQP